MAMKSGRYIGVMSGTSLDGVDVVLAAIDENLVAQQASYCHPMPPDLRQAILAVCQGQSLTLSQLGQPCFIRTRINLPGFCLILCAGYRNNRGAFSTKGVLND